MLVLNVTSVKTKKTQFFFLYASGLAGLKRLINHLQESCYLW